MSGFLCMYKHFLKYTEKQRLFAPKTPVLLAVSGGIDSMVMATLFVRSGQPTGIAHCNFGLRGNESDSDEAFVRQFAQQHSIPFFTTCFNTAEYAATHGLSIQMAARELRYEWFNKIAAENNYSNIAVAHHAGDLAETLLLNLIRGTGLKGLCSMAPVNGNIIRPLLFATRESIQQYATENNIDYREDRSNASDDYTRNYIRHHIIPQLEKLNPSLVPTLQQNAAYFTKAYVLLKKETQEKSAHWCKEVPDGLHINSQALLNSGAPEIYLHEWLQPFGFNSTQIDDITTALDGQSGKRFHSATHEAVKDREELIVTRDERQKTRDKRRETDKDSITHRHCEEERRSKLITHHSSLSIINYQPGMEFPRSPNEAWLDASKLTLPLTVRRWQEGDHFVPLGMKGKKKLSDFFIDNKIPVHQKEKQLVVCSGDDIVWVVGQRIDDRYKVTPATKQIYRIIWNN